MSLPEEKFAAMVAPNQLPLINIGAGKDISIGELAALVAQVVGFKGRIELDSSNPDGMPQKLLDVSRLPELGWRAKIGLRQGIFLAYEDFLRGTVGESGEDGLR